MATKIERVLVCDFGEKHSGEIRRWRIAVDGEHKNMDLCPNCSRPLLKIWDRGGEAKPLPRRMKVYDIDEIEAQKSKRPPSAHEG